MMYIFFNVLFLVCLACIFLNFRRKKKIIRKLCSMSCKERCCKINEIIEPFGYCYDCSECVFSTRTDAWQREFGFRGMYDRSAAAFNMVYDCEPVYFDYQGKTWLIEFWKGQYGINVGGEIGVYQANRIVSAQERSYVLFHSVDNNEMLGFTIKLNNRQDIVFQLSQIHWWLAGFQLGNFEQPENLSMDISIRFSDCCMMRKFLNGMLEAGYCNENISICSHTVSFTFDTPHAKQPRYMRPFRSAYSQWMNRWLCRVFHWITRPFKCPGDKVLYLYYYIPFVFRRILCCKKQKRWKRRR